MILMQHTAQMY